MTGGSHGDSRDDVLLGHVQLRAGNKAPHFEPTWPFDDNAPEWVNSDDNVTGGAN
jgi:hypothetical protein